MSESIFLGNSFSKWWILGEISRIMNNYDWKNLLCYEKFIKMKYSSQNLESFSWEKLNKK